MSDAEEFGFLKLYDPEGNEVPASVEDLLSIEGMSFDKELHRRVVGNRSGRYWLISDRPGFHAMLLEVSIFHCYPREGDEWEISYCSNGIASYPHWEFESATRHACEKSWSVDPVDGAPIPESVLAIAREHVAYRLGRTPGPDPLDIHGIRTNDAAEIREKLTEFTEGTVDLNEFLRQVAGKRIAIFELLLAVTFFCGAHNLDGREDDILAALIPENQVERFNELLQRLEGQISPED